MSDEKRCPDGGRCHHTCDTACFRVQCCAPLSNVYPNDRWPDDVKLAHGGSTEKPKLTEQSARDLLSEYPDADLSAFDTEGLDIEALARAETHKSIAKLEARADAMKTLEVESGEEDLYPDTNESLANQKRRALEALGISSEEAEAGARFSVVTDHLDERFQIVTLRMPRVVNLNETKLEGVEAQWRAMKFFLATGKSVVDMLMQTLPMHLVSALAMGGVSHALDMIGVTLAAIDEKRREREAEKRAQH